MENNKIRILLLVAESWRDDSAGGNVINNILSGLNAEFAHIFCETLLPKNNLCKKYYQITHSMVIKNAFNRKPVGKELDYNMISRQEAHKRAKLEDNKLNFFRKHRFEIFVISSKILWYYSNWKNERIEKFIKEFNPDVIFAPCYGNHFMLALTRYVADLTGKKIVTFSGDDNYSLKQWRLSPLFWIDRFILRRNMRKTFPYYDSFYSMSEDEIKQLSSIVGKEMKILRKGVHLSQNFRSREPKEPIKMIYAGGVYIGRWKVLAYIGKVLRKINKDRVKIQLDIYTGTPISKKQYKKLNNGRDMFLHSVVSKEELTKLYCKSDIAIHAESFSLKERYTTRLSFSTKIIDCLASGCAVMAIAWKNQTGLKYLKKEDAAICIESLKDIEEKLIEIIDNPEILKTYAESAYKCVERNHRIEDIQNQLWNNFIKLSDRDIVAKKVINLEDYEYIDKEEL